MTRINIEKIYEKLETDLRQALIDAVRCAIPEAKFNKNRLFQEFVRAVRSRCRTWEKVPDQYVEAED